ncbi:MAG TPA: lipoprotein signal peptidase [Cytophagaceae bacterium]|nr:lipoprotein signal peptidase [Cytophagaceae bacterium]
MKYTKYYLLTIGIILADQLIKIAIYKNFAYEGDEIRIFGDWFKLHYITNPGMAGGIEFGGKYGKIFLSIFRLFAMVAIGYYLYVMAKKKMHPGLLWCVAAILGGAIGNVVDSIFYGKFLNLTTEGALTPWFHGKVIDMFYVDICDCYIPNWVPGLGGTYYPLWPIFNFADASIFVSVAFILVFQKRFFDRKTESEETISEAHLPENLPQQ